ncbi:hypothetical protein PHMEG_00029643 [Phytophthora megakarya]|uniref:RNase H type-1 domain-containing protein n=1 Tax=Phytophthora megakarya TaxID=4795 RepID=A0A225V4M4_9STRA|nr:hypothetical protein PHMEG_00029643 [Phytophthora megakarya]
MPPVIVEMLEADYQGYVLGIDGAGKVSTRRGSCGFVKADRHILEGVMVNDAEYHGLILGLKLAMKFDVKELVAPNLQRRLAEYEDLSKDIVSVRLIHVKREFNQAADYLTSKTLELDDPDEIVHLRLVSKIPEKIMKPSEIPGTHATDVVCPNQVELGTGNPGAIPESLAAAAEVLMVMTRPRAEADTGSWTLLGQSGYQDERWRRIKAHQDADPWILQMKKVLKGDVADLPRKQVKKIAKVSDHVVLDWREVIYRLSTPTPERPRNKQSEPQTGGPRDFTC